MFVSYDHHCSVYGGDNYYSYGLDAVLKAELIRIKKNNPAFVFKKMSVWVLTEVNLIDIMSFTRSIGKLPDAILCNKQYIRIFEGLPLFRDVLLIDLKSSVRYIGNAFSIALNYGVRISQRKDFSALPNLSPRQVDIAKLFIKGRSPSCCAKTLNISVKTFSSHKRSLMGKLNVGSDLELITALKINEQFSRLRSAPPATTYATGQETGE